MNEIGKLQGRTKPAQAELSCRVAGAQFGQRGGSDEQQLDPSDVPQVLRC
jgi:hypothetical protein